ncbi:MAG: 4Fe-4S ferredoxin [Pseudomonadota bacterium]
MGEKKCVNLISVYIYGKYYEVPDSFTIMRAYEYTGHRYLRGCGCKGGVCGACGAIYVVPGVPVLKTGLACQTQVSAGMSIIQLPYFPIEKSKYELDSLSPDIASIGQVFPKIYKCLACNTCTKMCPQDIDVMGCMSSALRGDIEKVAVESVSCVMCGLCTSRCPAEICQYDIMLLCRRVYGKYIQKPYRHLPMRLKQIENREFDGPVAELMTLDMDTLKERYKKQQEDKQII